ncbi:MAG: hypothetical protein AAGM22_16005 [Acidobacteriota bacterium]
MPVIVILLGGWAMLEVMTWQAGLGDYARSPQRVQLRQGLTSLVGGGRAGLVFVEERFRKKAQILVRCEAGRRTLNMRPGAVSEEICGVQVELLAILSDGLINVEVRWGDDLGRDRTDDGQVPTSHSAEDTQGDQTETVHTALQPTDPARASEATEAAGATAGTADGDEGNP